MTKHSMVTFRLHRMAVIFMIVGAVLVAALLVGAGYLLGKWRRPAAEVVGRLKPAAPLGAAQKPAAVVPTETTEPLAVRVAMFDTEEEAKGFVQQLAARKLAASILPVNTSAGMTLYTVQVGSYPTRAAADAAAKSLTDEYGLHTAVVPAGAGRIKAP